MRMEVIYELQSRGIRQVTGCIRPFSGEYAYWIEATTTNVEFKDVPSGYSSTAASVPGIEEIKKMKKEAKEALVLNILKEKERRIRIQTVEEILAPDIIEI